MSPTDQPVKNCFVIIGYGEKIDLATQRKLNLDMVFENIIKPAFDTFKTPKFNCFRACDENYGGVIDVEMYKWIYQADFVLADISTLNPNVIYELGIRHALKPYSTLVIAEDGIRELPFDINHVKIQKYRHLGEDIGVAEAKRFIKVLTDNVQNMLDKQVNDSPVYTYIQRLKPPFLEPEPTVVNPDARGIAPASPLPLSDAATEDRMSLTALIKEAEAALKKSDFSKALRLFMLAELRDQSNLSLKRSIIYATYKTENPDKEHSYRSALELFDKNFDLNLTIDTRVLELGATIHQQLAEIAFESGDKDAISKALLDTRLATQAYERSYVLSRNFFTGGNYANVLMLNACHATDLQEKYILFIRACLVWKDVLAETSDIINEKRGKSTSPNKKTCERFLQAALVLSNGDETPEILAVRNELYPVQSEQQHQSFLERVNKAVNRVQLLRQDLKNLKDADLFLLPR